MKKAKERLITLSLLLVLISAGFYLGWSFKPPRVEALTFERIVEKPVLVEKVVEVVKEIPIETIKTVYIDQPIEKLVYPDWKVFNSINDMPKATVAGLAPDNCLDVAQAIQQAWLDSGYVISIAVARNGYYNGTYVTDASGSHAGLLIQTKEGWYFIDPIPWQITRLF